MKIIGHNIRKYRTINNMSIEKLSKLINLSPEYLKKIENQKIDISISINSLYKISIILKVPFNKFLEYNND